ncbi:hypothetical protein SCHPADRAFT_833395 [Schizopora paradoxa]|uniref:Uncharacterized protein n=1 Tax=Schizopora paradoxa TaxID=27342 RepID=A0A0H2RE95_9AGAM|nr:hypothetical protein SCHPADRAFT_833395 [Schizopora paradoxa]
MPFNLPSVFKTFETLILSWTSYAPLAKASDPEEFDAVLRKAIRDIKFHCETFNSFMGTTMRNGPLISWTLASLLYSLISYTALEAMSGESLHLHISTIPAGRPLLACLAKFPALTVLATLCALAVTSWNSAFTAAVLVACAGVLVLVLALRFVVGEGASVTPGMIVGEGRACFLMSVLRKLLGRNVKRGVKGQEDVEANGGCPVTPSDSCPTVRCVAESPSVETNSRRTSCEAEHDYQWV